MICTVLFFDGSRETFLEVSSVIQSEFDYTIINNSSESPFTIDKNDIHYISIF